MFHPLDGVFEKKERIHRLTADMEGISSSSVIGRNLTAAAPQGPEGCFIVLFDAQTGVITTSFTIGAGGEG